MKKILITGCNGQLGRAVQQVYAGDDVEFILTDVVEGAGIISLDITSIDKVLACVRAHHPDVIMNCAAHTNVDRCEEEWDLAYQLNAIGPRNLSIAAADVHAKLIHISTDYVFDGKGSRPYIEYDPVHPVSAYGKTKLEGENYVRQFAERYYILRTAWLYGDGRNFVKTMLNLAERLDQVTVVCDQQGSPTSAVELARVIRFLEGTDNYGLFHATCEGDTNWAAFAELIFSLCRKSVPVIPVTSAKYKEMNPASADRPAYSILDNYMLRLTTEYRMADWQDALKEYLKLERFMEEKV